jgi:hypothetical protein
MNNQPYHVPKKIVIVSTVCIVIVLALLYSSVSNQNNSAIELKDPTQEQSIQHKNEYSIHQSNTQKANVEKQYKDTHIYIGDPENKIQKILGEPDRINRSVTSTHVSKQYVYGNGTKYIYTEDGIVTSFQD